MKVLIACEESQRVCIAFRKRGHEAYSCDIQEPSGGHPEWHILGDALRAIEGGKVTIMDLTVSGNRYFNLDRYGDEAKKRLLARLDAARFFLAFALADVPRIAVENPVGVMSTLFHKPDQIIQPYFFGDAARKTTCLWLKNLPCLEPTNYVAPGEILPGGYSANASANYATDENGKILRWSDPRTAKERSKTFPGIAEAMAEQWGKDGAE